MKKRVEKTLTEKRLTRWTVADRSLTVGAYAIPIATLSTYCGVNCKTWIEQSNGWSIGVGWATFILASILTVFGLTTFDELISKKLSKLYIFGIVLMVLGGSALCFAKLYEAFGCMLLCTGAGLIGGGISSTVEKSLTSKKLAKYKEALKGLGILKEEKKIDEIKQQGEKDAEIIKKREAID